MSLLTPTRPAIAAETDMSVPETGGPGWRRPGGGLGCRSPSGPGRLEVGLTSQGSAHGRFTRAIANKNVRGAEIAAKELGGLSLYDALDYLVTAR